MQEPVTCQPCASRRRAGPIFFLCPFSLALLILGFRQRGIQSGTLTLPYLSLLSTYHMLWYLLRRPLFMTHRWLPILSDLAYRILLECGAVLLS
ncbi:hypothetical protein F4775DRAFT_363362 [Biscogniauxia sp. FL1348]|nr:hypothetical protein F4775DRAFT_363362 [Biscogniauxia sp. FL1348]